LADGRPSPRAGPALDLARDPKRGGSRRATALQSAASPGLAQALSLVILRLLQQCMSTPQVIANPIFATTRWTMVLNAGRTDSPEAARALADLCRTYWYPLYAYVRR